MTDFSEIHDELRAVAVDLLSKDSPDWPLLVQAGWVGLDAPEDAGGAGATFAEVAVICEEIGRAAASTGYFGGAVVGIGALLAVQPNESRDARLASVLAGESRVALALPADSVGPDVPFRLTATGSGWRIGGRAAFVLDTAGAQRLLLPALLPEGVPVLVQVDADALTIDNQPVLDETRRLATVSADAVEVETAAVWRFDGDPDTQLRRLGERAALAVACDSVGVAQAMLDATVSYTGVRQQFGRAIGSFQAVKHACADMLVQISVARQLVSRAVEVIGTDAAGVAVSMAKSYACDTAVEVAGKAMQLHGGIGYTWEGEVHVYLKRAALNRSLFGAPTEHRARLAQRYR